MINDQMEKMYIKYHKELLLYALSLCKDYHLAQDLASDTFFKAYLSLGDEEYLKYWLFRVCKNLYVDYVRKNKEVSVDRMPDDTRTEVETPLDMIIKSEHKQKIYAQILRLHESYKELLILFYYCDFSVKEISRMKDLSESAVKTTLFRARRKLKRLMEVEHEV